MGSKARTARGAGHKIQALCFHAQWSRCGNPYSLQLILVVPPAREPSDIARKLNPLLQGWLNFYGRAVGDISNGESINATLVAWAMREYKRYAGQKIRAGRMIGSIAINRPRLFSPRCLDSLRRPTPRFPSRSDVAKLFLCHIANRRLHLSKLRAYRNANQIRSRLSFRLAVHNEHHSRPIRSAVAAEGGVRG